MNEIPLPGCRPEPLLSYMKALGVFRLVAEQADQAARAAWRDDLLILHTRLNQDELLDFFVSRYEPSPIVVPWSGKFFVEYANKKAATARPLKVASAPRKGDALTALLATTTPRLDNYRRAVTATLEIIRQTGLKTKKDLDSKKAMLLNALRAQAPDSLVVWLDVAAHMDAGDYSFNALLGSGGGSDGNSHFSDNFLQNLWDVLPDFDSQRKVQRTHAPQQNTAGLLMNSLFDALSEGLTAKRTSALFDSGAVGGANATQGMERDALTNPWNFILGLEGALCLAGAASRRLKASRSSAAFPFTVRSRAVGSNTFSANRESGQWEIWLPIWPRPLGLAEMSLLFSEGRAEVRGGAARDGVDFARAVASYGIDRGIGSFARYAIVKGRIGGDNYNTAAALGRFSVSPQPGADLLNEIDRWLQTARRACDSSDAPGRFRSAMRRLDDSIMTYCRFGGRARFANLLAALGGLERELGRTGRKPGQVGTSKTNVPPVPLLSPRWAHEADDGSVEFRLALAVASIGTEDRKSGGLRAFLDPISLDRHDWVENSKTADWSSGDLPRNLVAVLERLLLEARRVDMARPPLDARCLARPADIAVFLAGALDDQRLEELLWGAILLNWRIMPGTAPRALRGETMALPRIYALLKLLYLPTAHALPTISGRPLWPEPQILSALRAGYTARACQLAVRRLRSIGYQPMPSPESAGLARKAQHSAALNAMRLAASLLIPLAVNVPAGNRLPLLAQLVLRDSTIVT